MEKIQIDKPGSYDQLRLVTTTDLQPEPGKVLVSVHVAGVNYADCMVRMGLYASAKKYVGWPITPGFDFAGIVEKVGAGVSKFHPGQQVFGITRFGGYATQVLVPAAQLFPLLPEMSLAQAGGVPTVFLTAWYALRELCKLRPGMKILVHSASGGVGSAALQLSRAFGCEPIGIVGGPAKFDVALKHGAVKVFDKRAPNLWNLVREAAPEGYAVVMDPNGEQTLRQSYKALAPMGRLLVYGFSSMVPMSRGKPSYLRLATKYLKTPRFNPISMTGSNKSVMAFNLSYLFDRHDLLTEGMDELIELFVVRKLIPLDMQSYPLAQAAEAHRALESGATIGKLVLMTGAASP